MNFQNFRTQGCFFFFFKGKGIHVQKEKWVKLYAATKFKDWIPWIKREGSGLRF